LVLKEEDESNVGRRNESSIGRKGSHSVLVGQKIINDSVTSAPITNV
jgi:hypothetical protein